MSTARQPSWSYSGRHARRESTTAEDLTTSICRAVEETGAGITVASDRDARCFFAKADQEQILDPTSLGKLFKDLIAEQPECLEILSVRSYLTRSDKRGWTDHTPDLDDLIDDCVRATEVRKALLSLFLYLDREQLLSVFLRWTLRVVTENPSDESTFQRDISGKIWRGTEVLSGNTP
jgi:hypothetical protein